MVKFLANLKTESHCDATMLCNSCTINGDKSTLISAYNVHAYVVHILCVFMNQTSMKTLQINIYCGYYCQSIWVHQSNCFGGNCIAQ